MEEKLNQEHLNNKIDETIEKHLQSQLKDVDPDENLLDDSNRQTNMISINSIIKLEEQIIKHHGIECQDCSVTPIEGIRYHCIICAMDMCAQCNSSGNHPDSHPIIMLK